MQMGKRKTPDNEKDFDHPNPNKKKRKVDNLNINNDSNNDDSNSESNSSLSNHQSITSSDLITLTNPKKDMNLKNLNNLLSDIQNNIFDCEEYQQLEKMDFARQLVSVSNGYIEKTIELQKRKNAVANFLELYKLKCDIHNCYRDYKTSNYNLLKDILVSIRNENSERRRMDVDYNIISYWDYSEVDVALKTVKPHKTYIQNMYNLLKDYIGGVRGICSIICNYSHNGYIWYGFRFIKPDSESDEYWKDCNDGIIFNLEFDSDDYFRDSNYYHNKKSKTMCGITFSSMQDDLNIPELTNISHQNMSVLILSIYKNLFGDESFVYVYDVDKWVEEVHT
eukprot:239448_1